MASISLIKWGDQAGEFAMNISEEAGHIYTTYIRCEGSGKQFRVSGLSRCFLFSLERKQRERRIY